MDLQTPWTVNDRDGDAEGFPPHPYPDTSPWCNHILVTGGEMVVAHINADAGLESAALAEFICRAANAHAELVEVIGADKTGRTLEDLLRTASAALNQSPYANYGALAASLQERADGIRSALALARPAREGEEG